MFNCLNVVPCTARFSVSLEECKVAVITGCRNKSFTITEETAITNNCKQFKILSRGDCLQSIIKGAYHSQIKMHLPILTLLFLSFPNSLYTCWKTLLHCVIQLARREQDPSVAFEKS